MRVATGSDRHAVEPAPESTVRFTLIYEGSLPSNGNPRQKHGIRCELHSQLKKLWTNEPLSNIEKPEVAGRQSNLFGDLVNGFDFVSLVHSRVKLRAELDLLMLRPGPPGQLVSAGDIDNRLKTLFDALRMPSAGELPNIWTPSAEERPLYCLLEDDRLITRFNVEVAELLSDNSPRGSNYCHLVIRVTVRAASPTYATQMIIS